MEPYGENVEPTLVWKNGVLFVVVARLLMGYVGVCLYRHPHNRAAQAYIPGRSYHL